MNVSQITTHYATLEGKKGETESDLERTRAELAQLRASMGAAVLAGKDPAKIANQVAGLQARESVLVAAVEAAQTAMIETQGDLRAAELAARAAELEALTAQINSGVSELIKNLYSELDVLAELNRAAARAGHIIAANPGLGAPGLSSSAGVLSAAHKALDVLRRQIEFGAAGLVETAGEKRRF